MKEFLKIIFNIVFSFTNPTWQQTVLLLSIIILFIFTKEIKLLINRVEKLKYKDTEVQWAKQDPPKEPFTQEADFAKNKGENISPTLKKYMQDLKCHIDNQRLKSENEKIEYLERLLSYSTYILMCERIYAKIFGGQIQILKELQSNKHVSDEVISSYIIQGKKQNPEFFEKWDVNTYMNYLLTSNLVMFSDKKYSITFFGEDFLNWMRQQGISENKPY